MRPKCAASPPSADAVLIATLRGPGTGTRLRPAGLRGAAPLWPVRPSAGSPGQNARSEICVRHYNTAGGFRK